MGRPPRLLFAFQQSLRLPSGLILLASSTMKLPKIIAKLMPSTVMLVTRLVQSLGELVELLHVFHVYVVVVLTDQVKVLSVTCAAVDTCSLLPRFTAAGIERLM